MVLNWGQFCSPKPPQELFDNLWRHFWFLQLGRCYWHPVGRGQGCCYRTAPHHKEASSLQVCSLRGWETCLGPLPRTMQKCFSEQGPTLSSSSGHALAMQALGVSCFFLPVLRRPHSLAQSHTPSGTTLTWLRWKTSAAGPHANLIAFN